MKALSLKQPFAELVVSGKKTIELRTWNTKFRGEFLIHASKVPDKDAMKQFGFSHLPCGGIVGKATLVDVTQYHDEKEHAQDKHLHLAHSAWGSHGFILERPKKLPFMPCLGALGFWEYKEKILS